MYIHINNGIHSALRKKEILPFVIVWVNLEGLMLGEMSQIKKDKYCLISLTHGI